MKNGEYGILLLEAIESLKDKDFLPYLENNLKAAQKDSNIQEVWITDLKLCLEKLKV